MSGPDRYRRRGDCARIGHHEHASADAGAARPGRSEAGTGREAILEAAADLFTRQGYAATSTRAVALAVGIKQASLYYHFAQQGGDPRRAALGDRRAVPARGAPAGADAGAGRPRGCTRSPPSTSGCSRPAAGTSGRSPCCPRCATPLRPVPRRPRPAARRPTAGSRPPAAEEGDARPVDAEVAADLVFGLVESVIVVRAEREDAGRLARVVEQVPPACLRLLGVPASRLPAITRESARLVDSLT